MKGVYSITNTVTGDQYIGASTKIKKRWAQHRTDLRRGEHKSEALLQAWRQYGEHVFAFECIVSHVSGDLHYLERVVIADRRPTYNRTVATSDCEQWLPPSARLITHGDRTMSLSEWARHTGIPKTTILQRIDALGWSVDDALTLKPGEWATTHLYRGKQTPLRDIAAATGLSETTIRKRIARGEPADAPPKKKGARATKVIAQGVLRTYDEWADVLRVDRRRLRYLISKGEKAGKTAGDVVERLLSFREEFGYDVGP